MRSSRVTVWNEHHHERESPAIARTYPDGIHGAIAEGIEALLGERASTRVATQPMPEHGLTPQILDDTDVLIWWGHRLHDQVDDDVVDRVCARVYSGMGLIVLHSAHHSKVFKRLMGTTCNLRWRDDERENVFVVNPSHPIAEGLPEAFVIPEHEMYGEYFDIPQPDELVFVSGYESGEVFRSGCCFVRGRGRIFYFSPGHETVPVYYQPEVRQVIANAVVWASPRLDRPAFNDDALHSPAGWIDELGRSEAGR